MKQINSRNVIWFFSGFLFGFIPVLIFWGRLDKGTPSSPIGRYGTDCGYSSMGNSHYDGSIRSPGSGKHSAINIRANHDWQSNDDSSHRQIPLSFDLIDDDGYVTKGALDQAGVPVEKLDDIQRLVDKLRSETEAGMKERIFIGEKACDKSKGITVYRIPSDRMQADQILSDFQNGLINAVGKGSAKILMDGFHPKNRFGWYGRLDLRISVVDPPADDGNSVIEWDAFDPSSRKRVCGGWCIPEKSGKYFGGLFETKTD